MKKLFILLFFFTAILWAEIDVEMSVRIENVPENLFIDADDMDKKDYEACSVFFEKKVRSDIVGLICGYAGLCRSMLDTNVLIGWTDGRRGFFDGLGIDGAIEFYVLTEATHTVREIIEDEFVGYRKCYLFTNNDSIFNSMFLKIDSVLVHAINECLQKKKCSTRPLIFDYLEGKMRDFIYPGPNYEFIGFALDTVNARNAAISSIAPAKYKLESIRVQNHQLSVSPKLLGREFVLFDVNGHELRRGTLQNNMRVPAYPTVIKIQGFGTKLLNSR